MLPGAFWQPDVCFMTRQGEGGQGGGHKVQQWTTDGSGAPLRRLLRNAHRVLKVCAGRCFKSRQEAKGKRARITRAREHTRDYSLSCRRLSEWHQKEMLCQNRRRTTLHCFTANLNRRHVSFQHPVKALTVNLLVRQVGPLSLGALQKLQKRKRTTKKVLRNASGRQRTRNCFLRR